MLNIPGLIGLILIYMAILAVGLYAAWKKKAKQNNLEEVMLAGRDFGTLIGILTMTATWVGGGYINGAAEKVFDKGLIWCQAPFGYGLSLALGGAFFARPMRKKNYVTMLDPLQDAFGKRMGGLLYFPAFLGETFWSAAILSALGSTISVILEADETLSVYLSATVAVAYTITGGLYSVAFTDVIQLLCIFVGLILTVPFAMKHESVGPLTSNSTEWLGHIEPTSPEWGEWIDYWLLLICGGIPWQVYFQRVLSTRSSKQAQTLSFCASIGCILIAVPACIIGAIAKVTDWTKTEYGKTPVGLESRLILPLVIKYLTPSWVSFIGLSAVAAAVMSSADSSVLSAASMFATNIYRNIFKQKASEREVIWVMRISIVVIAFIAATIAVQIQSIYYLFKLCGDLVYVILFPQLLLVVHFQHRVNTYGSFFAFVIGFSVRILAGEPYMGIPAVIIYPYFDYETGRQYFPVRTMAMLVSSITLLLVSAIAKALWLNGIVDMKYDVFNCFRPNEKDKHLHSSEVNGIENINMENPNTMNTNDSVP